LCVIYGAGFRSASINHQVVASAGHAAMCSPMPRGNCFPIQ